MRESTTNFHFLAKVTWATVAAIESQITALREQRYAEVTQSTKLGDWAVDLGRQTDRLVPVSGSVFIPLHERLRKKLSDHVLVQDIMYSALRAVLFPDGLPSPAAGYKNATSWVAFFIGWQGLREKGRASRSHLLPTKPVPHRSAAEGRKKYITDEEAKTQTQQPQNLPRPWPLGPSWSVSSYPCVPGS